MEQSRLQRVLVSYLDHFGLNMRELSLRVGDTPGLVNDLLRRSNAPRRTTLQKLARAMGIPADDLIGAERPFPDWTSLRQQGQVASADSERPPKKGTLDARPFNANRAAPTATIQIVDVDPNVRGFVLASQDLTLDINMDFVRLVLGARPEFLRLYMSPNSVPGAVGHGDRLLVDVLSTTASAPGIYVRPDGSVSHLSDGSIVLGRAVWSLKRL